MLLQIENITIEEKKLGCMYCITKILKKNNVMAPDEGVLLK